MLLYSHLQGVYYGLQVEDGVLERLGRRGLEGVVQEETVVDHVTHNL